MKNVIGIFIILAHFNWFAPADEECLGPIDYDTKQPTVECIDLDMGVTIYDVRLG